jgi:hypothetical protein
MNETPPLPGQEVESPVQETEQGLSMPIEDWAKQNNHKALLGFIESSDQTNRNVGVFRENMIYDPVAKSMTLIVSMKPELHRGHTLEGEHEVMLGGKPKDFADVVSGALAFTEVPTNSLPLHTKIIESDMGVMILQHEAPVLVRSTFVRDPEEGAPFSIKTVVSQGPHTCFTEVCEVKVGTERGVARVAQMTKTSLDAWVLEQKNTGHSSIQHEA